VLAFARLGHHPHDTVVVVANFTPVVRHGYRVGVPRCPPPVFSTADDGAEDGAEAGCLWREVLNTDSAHYGGSNLGNQGQVLAQPIAMHGQAQSVSLTLPPLSVIWLKMQPAPDMAEQSAVEHAH
jgi:1,4-alpha-glucan branching enzyme